VIVKEQLIRPQNTPMNAYLADSPKVHFCEEVGYGSKWSISFNFDIVIVHSKTKSPYLILLDWTLTLFSLKFVSVCTQHTIP